MNSVSKSVAIIGGGFSGTVLAAQLLRRIPNLSLAIIDNSPVPARGLAYGTELDCHLLNVPAGNMSALPEEPDHFVRWARQNHEASIHPRSFLPRALYGRYLDSILKECETAGGSGFEWIRGHAISLQNESEGFAVRLGDGSKVLARTVVLALGNFPPGNLGIPGLTERSEGRSQRYFRFAWSPEAVTGLSDHDAVLLIGSGLTSVDIALALHAKGFRGKIHLLSRHGLVPQVRGPASPWPRFWDDRAPRTTHSLLRLIREQAASACAAGAGWNAVMDSLRPHIQEIWQSLPVNERRRFLRHARAYWEVHRHRIAPEVADSFSRMIASGQVEIHAGRIVRCCEQDNAFEVEFRRRGASISEKLRVVRVINCSGPETDCRKIESPLLRTLLAQGLIRQDTLHLGLDVSTTGAALDSAGRTSPGLFALGPMRKADLWESTAVPELRVQVSNLAEYLAATSLRSEASGVPGTATSWPLQRPVPAR